MLNLNLKKELQAYLEMVQESGVIPKTFIEDIMDLHYKVKINMENKMLDEVEKFALTVDLERDIDLHLKEFGKEDTLTRLNEIIAKFIPGYEVSPTNESEVL